jgi:hypothetical protein
MAFISRNPFARSELHREQVEPHGATCSWCGSLNRNGKLFQYRSENDDNPRRNGVARGLFCSVGCLRIFNS